MEPQKELPSWLTRDLNLIAQSVFNRFIYKIKVEEEAGITTIAFEAYLGIASREENQLHVPPFDPYFRYEDYDFDIWIHDKSFVNIGGKWRSARLQYYPKENGIEKWVNEDHEPCPRPYPHADEFEELAKRFDERIKAYYAALTEN